MKFKNNIAVLLWILLVSLSIQAQNKSKDKDKEEKPFEVRTNLLVLDEKDKYVSGLKESDVKVFENGIEQKLTYFATKDQALNVCLVVDNSYSVRRQLEQIMTVTKLLVANFGPADEAQVIRFIGKNKIGIEQEWTNKKADLNFAIDNFFTEGGETAVVDALYLAGEDILKRRKTAPNKRYAIVLISDGEDRSSYYTLKQLLQLLAGTDVQIFTIALVKDLSDEFGFTGNSPKSGAKKIARKIAAGTAGTSFILDENAKATDYGIALKSLIYELRSQIVIGYVPTDPKKDPIRKLAITIADGPNGEKRKVMSKQYIMIPQD